MENDEKIILNNVYKSFKVYRDKSYTLTERLLTRGRNKHVRHQVLMGIDFTVNKGEVIGLIGENGSGKSTALKLISRIIYPDQGTVQVKGRVSCLIELGAGFHPDLSGRENIYTNASIFGLTKKEIDDRLEEIIAFSELWDFIDNPIRTYSSGMYMRLAFSVAINVDADVLLIDEILSVGDKNFQQKCFEKLEELKKKGVTIIIVTHDLSTVEQFCTRVIWVNNGKIAADDIPGNAINQYHEYMFEKQLLIEKRKQEEHRKSELAKKDFTKDDIVELYMKYFNRKPETEDVINSYFENFEKKREIEQQIKSSLEYIAIQLRKRQMNEQEDTNQISKQDVINIYETYLLREPENDYVIEACCNAYRTIDQLVYNIKKSPEYIELMNMEKDGNQIEIPKQRSVVIKGIFTADSAGRKTDRLVSGQPSQIILEYRLNKPQKEYVFGVEAVTGTGAICFKYDTLHDKIKIKSLNERGVVMFHIQKLNLFPGKYKLYASVLDAKGNLLDNERRLGEFAVIADKETDVLCTIDHTWSIQ